MGQPDKRTISLVYSETYIWRQPTVAAIRILNIKTTFGGDLFNSCYQT